jgi:hypothetical protein
MLLFHNNDKSYHDHGLFGKLKKSSGHGYKKARKNDNHHKPLDAGNPPLVTGPAVLLSKLRTNSGAIPIEFSLNFYRISAKFPPKRHNILHTDLGAFFCSRKKTGLSASIPRLRLRRSLRYFRFYPLRESKPLCGFDFAEFHFVKLQEHPFQVEFGAKPQTPKTKNP